ncbi:MAG TPA: NADP-dependent oxidoreductase [Thermoplasmata archaeon]|nr:NADP-dependent oxidoreductase [Thermoplasmata archaeon]
MRGATNRQWLVAAPPDGRVTTEQFRWAESPLPAVRPGTALVRNLWFDFGPTQILAMGAPAEQGGVPVGAVMRTLAVSQVVESQIPAFHPGDLVYGHAGWEDYSLIDGHGFFETTPVPAGVAPNLAAGTLGVTGLVAYFGVVEVGRAQPEETCVVTAAAGGVGSIAVQIARIRGLRVIGIAGGAAKGAWLRDEARVAAAIDHRTEDVAARLDALCPDGIDVFFDNVGGPLLDEGLARLRPHGRVVLCGITSWYLQKERPPGPSHYPNLIMKNGRMEGLLGRDYVDRFDEARPVLAEWIRSGELRSKEDVAVGLENAPRALVRMFDGANVGKQLLRLADPTP